VRHVDERLRSTADWLAEGVNPTGVFETVRRKKFRRRSRTEETTTDTTTSPGRSTGAGRPQNPHLSRTVLS